MGSNWGLRMRLDKLISKLQLSEILNRKMYETNDEGSFLKVLNYFYDCLIIELAFLVKLDCNNKDCVDVF